MSMEHMDSDSEHERQKNLGDLEQEKDFPTTESDSSGSLRRVSAGDLERLKSVREELDASGKKQTIKIKGFEEDVSFPVPVEKVGMANWLKRYLSVGLAALGLSGGSKLDAQTTNNVDQAAVKGSGTNITEVAKLPENTEGPVVYEQKSWDIKPEIKKAALERLQKSSGGSSVFTVPNAKEYTPPAPTHQTSENAVPVAKTNRPRRAPENFRKRIETDNGRYRPPLVQVNTYPPQPRPGENVRYDPNTGKYIREWRIGP